MASITYYKGEPGDEVVILTPEDGESVWAAVENVIRPGTSSIMENLLPDGSAAELPSGDEAELPDGNAGELLDGSSAELPAA